MLQAIFLVIVFLSLVLFYYGTGKDKKVLLFFSLWTAAIGIASGSGFFGHNTLPPRILVVIIPAVIYTVWLYWYLRDHQLQPGILLSVHILRIPVELVLYRLYVLGKVPVLMTFEGWNLDILTGSSALLLWLYLIATRKGLSSRLFRIWNISGLLFLGIIVGIALLSAPSPVQQLAFDRPNRALLEFPYTLLPAVVVPIVLLSHLLCLYKLREERLRSVSLKL